MRRSLPIIGLAVLVLVLSPACSEDEEAVPGQSSDCTVTLSPCSANKGTAGGGACSDQQAVQTAFIDTPADGTICFEAGTYRFTDELSITTRGITLKGMADGVVLNFADQVTGANGIAVTGDDFTIENISVVDTPGDSILVQGTTNAVFRDVEVSWSAGSVTENGAYAVYPLQVDNVLVEHCTVRGASDAGIYVGQSNNIIVRNNTVEGNVTGIEIENSHDAEVYNNTATDNTVGILVFNLPNLQVKDGARTRIYDNQVVENNRPNFAEEGNIVAILPAGIGVVIGMADQVEVHGNTITGNVSAGVFNASWGMVTAVEPSRANTDEEYDEFSETVFIHDNTYADNGAQPQALFSLVTQGPLGDIVWDGFTDPEKDNADGSLSLCIQEAEGTTFVNINGPESFGNHSNDLTPHDCTHPSLPPVSLSL